MDSVVTQGWVSVCTLPPQVFAVYSPGRLKTFRNLVRR
jgi:hypothetical protein